MTRFVAFVRRPYDTWRMRIVLTLSVLAAAALVPLRADAFDLEANLSSLHARDQGEPLVWSHSLEDQLDGQMAAGFVLTDLFEDVWPERKLSEYIGCFMGTRAVKLPAGVQIRAESGSKGRDRV